MGSDVAAADAVAKTGPAADGNQVPRDWRGQVVLPVGIYLAGQALTLLIVGLIAHAHGRSLHPLLSSWDGRHMLAIAAQGYSSSTEAGVSTSVAFFPGYPSVVSAVHTLTRLSYVNSGLAVSVGAGLATAIGLTRLCPTVLPGDDDRAPLILVALVSTAPMAIVLTMTYSESLFCALAVWALVLMTERQWIAAALAIELAGTVRQTAVALCVALAVAVIVAARRGEAPLRAWVALIVAPTGAISYLAWADRHTGVRGAWFDAQRNGWGASFDFGHDTWFWTYHAIVDAPALLDIATAAALITALALTAGLAILLGRRYPELIAYTAVVVGIDVLSAGIMNSKIRLLMPAMTLLVPVAHWISQQPTRLHWVVTGCLAVCGAYYSAYGLVLYGFAI